MDIQTMQGSKAAVLTFRRAAEQAITKRGFACTEIVPQATYMRGIIAEHRISGGAFAIVYDPEEAAIAFEIAQAFIDADNACSLLPIPEADLTDTQRGTDAAARIAEALQEISTDARKTKAASVDRLMVRFDEYVKKNQTAAPLKTHFVAFDKAIGGGFSPRLYVVGGESSVGKTAFVLQCAEIIATGASGTPVLYFTQEMGAVDLMARGISQTSYVQMKLSRGDRRAEKKYNALTETEAANGGAPNKVEDYEHAREVYLDCVGKHLHFFEGARTASEMREITRQFIAANGIKPLVVVDYLQLTKPEPDASTDRRVQIEQTVQAFTDMRRELEVPIIVITAYNRASYGNTATLSSAKESGLIEYSCDCYIALELAIKTTNANGTQEDKLTGITQEEMEKAAAANPREIRLKIIKNRANRSGVKIYYQYDAAYNHYGDEQTQEDGYTGYTPPTKDYIKTYKK